VNSSLDTTAHSILFPIAAGRPFDRVNGTGLPIRASSCHQNTNIKTKISVFTGSCGGLRCVTGHAMPDFECPILKRGELNNEWGTISTAVVFPTFVGEHYYILVQQESFNASGDVWMNFRLPAIPQNDNCVDAIGPVPRDMTPVLATSVDGSISDIQAGYCGGGEIPALYPGTWFQLMGTGGSVSVMACSEFNFDGYYFSVYNGADCDSLECVDGRYEIDVKDPERCSFGPMEVERSMTKFTFDTKDRSRYYIYVHFARTAADKPTADFRFFADDGKGGKAGTNGAHLIKFEESTTLTDGKDKGKGGDDDGDNEDIEGSGTRDGRPMHSLLIMSLLFVGALGLRSSLFS
jgi:hypothetical protein